MKRYLLGIFNAWSQLGNACLGGNPNESISGRSYRCNWRIMPLINALFFWQKNHCRSAYVNDILDALQYLENTRNAEEALRGRAQHHKV